MRVGDTGIVGRVAVRHAAPAGSTDAGLCAGPAAHLGSDATAHPATAHPATAHPATAHPATAHPATARRPPRGARAGVGHTRADRAGAGRAGVGHTGSGGPAATRSPRTALPDRPGDVPAAPGRRRGVVRALLADGSAMPRA
ncbi:hypothetical protein JOE68_005971 [Saccharothrix algeriensis]|uniref:Uncharacterized protein n=1 Tax=Saccharothrix algeriensis TaxID=173560 RepID=A0ABS2SFS6_9PSEU|nr:hypothetical protein [Saccharothrix algeriensis]